MYTYWKQEFGIYDYYLVSKHKDAMTGCHYGEKYYAGPPDAWGCVW